jgi:hypothetical protein
MLSLFLTHAATDFVAHFHKNKAEENFEVFFGPGAMSRQERGRIIIQADRIEALLEHLLSDQTSNVRSAVRFTLAKPERNRLYKARHWVNARDAASAKVVREGLRAQHFPTPELYIIEHDPRGDPFAPHAGAPYVISMGLGFTDTTKSVAEAVDPSRTMFGIEVNTGNGDAIVIRHDLMGTHYSKLLHLSQVSPGDAGDERRYLFPKDWDVDVWLRGEMRSNDYGLIARHTATVDGRKQTRFVLAGFTEDGTLAAGRYLVNRWERLLELSREKLRLRGDHHGQAADFIAVVAGDSRSTTTWTDDPFVFLLVPIKSPLET